jgi:hypothetical protein
VTLLSPEAGPDFYGRQPVIMQALVYDVEQGSRGVANIVWQSDRNGVLGNGRDLFVLAQSLSVGTHILTGGLTTLR